MMRIETFKSTTEMAKSINNGLLFTPINILMSPSKENSTLTLAFMLKETFTLSQNLRIIDTLTSSITETWSLRLQMEEKPNFGISINKL
jgi:hypothetical protein